MPDIPKEIADGLIDQSDESPGARKLAEKYDLVEALPAKITFPYSLHDNGTHDEFVEHIEWSTGHIISQELRERLYLNNPFYEIVFNCELDTATGEITFEMVDE